MKRPNVVSIRLSEIELEMARKLAFGQGINLPDLFRRMLSLEVDKHQARKDASHGN